MRVKFAVPYVLICLLLAIEVPHRAPAGPLGGSEDGPNDIVPTTHTHGKRWSSERPPGCPHEPVQVLSSYDPPGPKRKQAQSDRDTKMSLSRQKHNANLYPQSSGSCAHGRLFTSARRSAANISTSYQFETQSAQTAAASSCDSRISLGKRLSGCDWPDSSQPGTARMQQALEPAAESKTANQPGQEAR